MIINYLSSNTKDLMNFEQIHMRMHTHTWPLWSADSSPFTSCQSLCASHLRPHQTADRGLAPQWLWWKQLDSLQYILVNQSDVKQKYQHFTDHAVVCRLLLWVKLSLWNFMLPDIHCKLMIGCIHDFLPIENIHYYKQHVNIKKYRIKNAYWTFCKNGT